MPKRAANVDLRNINPTCSQDSAPNCFRVNRAAFWSDSNTMASPNQLQRSGFDRVEMP
jgi:hypothetical protein